MCKIVSCRLPMAAIATLLSVQLLGGSAFSLNLGTPRVITGPATSEPVDILSIDIDGDGDLDVLVGGERQGRIGWFENIAGTGEFSLQKTVNIPDPDNERYNEISGDSVGINAIDAADLDGDGDIDVICASHGDDKIAWFPNIDGKGTFGPQRVLSIPDPDGIEDDAHPRGAEGNPNSPTDVLAGDLDGDGDNDVVATSFFDDKISWYENLDGLGNFSTLIVVNSPDPDNHVGNATNGDVDGAYSLGLADIDGDSHLDILCGSVADTEISWFRNLGNATGFSPQRIIDQPGDTLIRLLPADLDGDGDQDVLAALPANDSIVWYDNTDGLGTFSSQKVITASAESTLSAFASDIDRDGQMDVVGVSRQPGANSAGEAFWFKNLGGASSFSTKRLITTDLRGPRAVIATDLNSDGKPDVVTASSSDNKVAWYPSLDGLGDFGPQEILSLGVIGVDSVAAGDIDGDGDKDIVCMANNGPMHLSWFENLDANGVFGPQQAVDIPILNPRIVALADLDGDNDLDIVSTVWDNIGWYRNEDGLGGFSERLPILSFDWGFYCPVKVGDIDGDGDNDLLLVPGKENKIIWLENTDGSGTFSSPNIITTAVIVPRDIDLTDLDGDGDLDALSASVSDQKLAWYENTDGQGTFGAQKIVSIRTDFATQRFEVADVDSDGATDVVVHLDNALRVIWFRNEDGLGTFGGERPVADGLSFPGSIQVRDMDLDGDVDVLTTDRGSNALLYVENLDGAGTFAPVSLVAEGVRYSGALLAASIDQHPGLDIIYAGSPYYSGVLVLQLNESIILSGVANWSTYE